MFLAPPLMKDLSHNLTSNIVVGWVTASIDYLAVESSNSSSIAERIVEKNANPQGNGLPWEDE